MKMLCYKILAVEIEPLNVRMMNAQAFYSCYWTPCYKIPPPKQLRLRLLLKIRFEITIIMQIYLLTGGGGGFCTSYLPLNCSPAPEMILNTCSLGT